MSVELIKNTRTILIEGEINSEVAKEACVAMLTLESEPGASYITIMINSPGGSVLDGFRIVDTMQMLACDVEVICTGLCASMAALILAAGTRGLRKILKHSRVLIHQPMLINSGVMQASDISIQAAELNRIKEMTYEFLSECTGKTIDEIALACDRNCWLSAGEALAFGIVDNIVSAEER